MDTEISRIIGDRNKIDMILGLYHTGPSNKTVVYSFTTNNNLNARKLDELENDGIILMTQNKFDNNKTVVELTTLGTKVVTKLIEIEGIISGKIAPVDAGTDYDPSTEQGNTVI
ncbi:MAG TPA: hypothetical protein VJY42_02000 [Candidatus Methanomethylophilaceae archaeon]|nr:hypothetical protein [Candidatus Methanomethylophilaceae archaeon]